MSIYPVGIFQGKLSAKIGGYWRFFPQLRRRLAFAVGCLDAALWHLY
ncbi:hypothetical protein [Microcystis sp. 0824]|nr:hypothetical protein [Microcystis sp. 0824]